MKYNVTIIQDNKTLDVVIEAKNLTEAKILTKHYYPKSRIIGVTQVTKDD